MIPATTSLPALRPPMGWRQQPPYPEPPAGYRLVVEGSADARALWLAWGVSPVHIGHCRYAIWLPLDGEPPLDARLGRAAQAWLAEGGRAALHVAERHYPFGATRICGYAEEMRCPLPAEAGGRARDIFAFFAAAKRVAAAFGGGPVPAPPPSSSERY